MPDVAAPILQPMAQFLAIGVPIVADGAVAGDFAALLAQQVVDMPVPTLPVPGKILPAGRQDFAALPLSLPVPVVIMPGEAALDGDIEDAVDGDAESDDDLAASAPLPEALFPILAMLTQPISTPTPTRPEPLTAERPATITVTAGDARRLAMPAIVPAEVRAQAVAPAANRAAAPIADQATIISDIADTAAPARPAPVQPAQLQPAQLQPAQLQPTPAHSVAFVMRAAPVAASAAMPIVQPAATPVVEIRAAEVEAADADVEAPVQDARPVRFVPQPVAEARNAAFALNADPVAEPVSHKRRAPVDAALATDASGLPVTPSNEIRGVAAPSATGAIDALPRDRAAALVETIAMLRSEAKGGTLNLAIQHDDFGPIAIRFEQADDSVVVRFDTRDADLARMIADATPDLKAAGEPHGMRFERRDAAGTGANMAGTNMGGSHDAPRHGREPAHTRSDQRPQSGATRGRGGIFA